MLNTSTHFEIFLRKNPRASWRLYEIVQNRDSALKYAKHILQKYKYGGIRISMERLNPKTGEFDSVIIAKLGDCVDLEKLKLKTKNTKNESTKLIFSCKSPADLFKPPAREEIATHMQDILLRYCVLPGELVFRPDIIENIEASHTAIMQGVQKAVIAHNKGDNLHMAVRQLKALVERAIRQLFFDCKTNILSGFNSKGVSATIVKIGDRKDFTYAMSFAIADKLRTSKDWDIKLETLLALLRETQSIRHPKRKRTIQIIESFLQEWLNMSPAREIFIKDVESSCDVLSRLVSILENKVDWDCSAAQALSRAISDGLIPNVRYTWLRYILAYLDSMHTLKPDQLSSEISLLHKLANRLLNVIDNSNDKEDVIKAFEAREMKTLSHSRIEMYLHGRSAVERTQLLIDIMHEVNGKNAKHKLISIIHSELKQIRFEREIINSNESCIALLRIMGQMQRSILNFDVDNDQKIVCAEYIDSIAAKCIRRESIFDKLPPRKDKILAKIIMLLQLAANELPQGQSAALVSKSAIRMLRSQTGRDALSTQPKIAVELKTLHAKAAKSASYST